MRRLLLPLLWIRTLLINLLVLIGGTLILLYSLANTPLWLGEVANHFAPDYNISYTKIEGRVWHGVTIYDLRYRDQLIGEKITVEWNLLSLIDQELHIRKLALESINLEGVTSLVEHLGGATEESHASSESNSSLAIAIVLEEGSISLAPFVHSGVALEGVRVEIKGVAYAKEQLDVAQLTLGVESNLTDLHYQGRVRSNQLIGQLYLRPKESLFEQYALPIHAARIGEVMIELNASKSLLSATLDKQVMGVLSLANSTPDTPLSIDMDQLHSHLTYDINQTLLRADTTLRLTTPYTQGVVINNHLSLDENLSYEGRITLDRLRGIDSNFTRLLDGLTLTYQSRGEGIATTLKSQGLVGSFDADRLPNGQLHLATKEPLSLHELLVLPPELNSSRVMVVVDAPICLEENSSHQATIALRSNLVMMDINVSYAKDLTLTATTRIPPNSLLKAYSPKLKWERLNPIESRVTLQDQEVNLTLQSDMLRVASQYELNTTQLVGEIAFGSLRSRLSGSVAKRLRMTTTTGSLSELMQSIQALYPLKEPLKVEGAVTLDTELIAKEKLLVALRTPKITYQSGRKSTQVVEAVDIALEINGSTLTLPHYTLTTQKQTLFATKPSVVQLGEDNLTIAPFWVNDALTITGSYAPKRAKGRFALVADRLPIEHELVKLKSAIDLTAVLDGNKTAIRGDITLLEGRLFYDLEKKSYASDSDILIVQEMSTKPKSSLMEGLSVAVTIKSQTPLLYKEGEVKVRLKPDLSLHKSEGAELMLLGSIELLKGGYYSFEQKRFLLNSSHLFFTGKPANALIEASVDYRTVEHVITITVTGSATAPMIRFSAQPYLSKEEILSMILFDSTAGAGTNSSEEMMRMMGGAMAKSALSNIGVKLDHLVLGEGNSIEVGKRLTSKITIIYVNDTISSVKLKYDHNRNTQSIMSVSEPSQSYDIVFRKDF